MITLGLTVSVNSTAALMVDGEIVACGCEDRFTRQKSVSAYPKNSIDFCLKYAGASTDQIDYVMLPYKDIDFTNPVHWITNYDATYSMEDKIREQHEYFKPLLIEKRDVDYLEIFKEKIIPERMEIIKRSRNGDFLDTCIEEHLGIGRNKVMRLDHHASHKYYALYSNCALKDPSLIFCMEGYGGESNGSVTVYRNGKMSVLYKTPYCWIARLYRYITLLLGMKSNEHEYKVMGLAPYSSGYTLKKPLEIFRETAYVDGLEIKFKHKPKDIYFYFKEKLEPYRFDGIAGALQRYTEEIICEWVRNAIIQTGVKDVVFTGGVAQNIKAMMELKEIPELDSLWVGATSSDESTAMGVLFQGAHERGIYLKTLKDVYLGSEYDEETIQKFITSKRLNEKYKVVENPEIYDIARRLESGEVMARFCGRAEFGARALGNRSILANPAYPNIVRIINEKIKNRDFWMPFAPVILHERHKDYLVNGKDIESPYMTIGFESTELARKHLPGALHPYDYTARPQILREIDNPSYYSLIKAFEKLTGIGGLLNTSFNLHGEPIVHSLQDALYVFEKSSLDFLQLGNNLIIKE